MLQSTLAVPLQLLLRAEAEIGLAFLHQSLGVLAIQLEAIALAIGCVRAADIGTLVPIDAEPLEIVEKLVLEARLAARKIGVLDAQHHDAAGLTGKEPVEERSAGVADVQLSRRRRSEANADLGSGAHPLMLARAEEESRLTADHRDERGFSGEQPPWLSC